MAEKQSRNSYNIAGPYYVDNNCIACDACIIEAPDFFKMNDSEGIAFVYNQPKSSIDIELCTEALESCPVEAIGSNGD